MSRKTPLLALGLFFLLSPALAQPRTDRSGPPAAITGQVYDSRFNDPVEYANIVVYRLRDSTQVNGTVSGPDGRFRVGDLRPGQYYIEVTFIGYRPRTVTDVRLEPGATFDIGRLDLRQLIVAVEGVETVAERPTLSYEIDKKVIDVGGLATAASGTAVDVLENVPTVKVDIEGNVSLRGSEKFTVLVDGRPSPLDPSDALQTIPAASIDRVEIITNPSARYDPDGVSGIINVILKQQRGSGLSGVLNGNLGLGNRYGTSGQLTWTSGIVTLQAGADYSRREGPGTRESWRSTTRGDTTSWVYSDGSSLWDGRFWGVRGGVDLQWTAQDRTSLSGRWGGRDMTNSNEARFQTWRVFAGDSIPTGLYTSEESSVRRPGFLSFNLEQRRVFGEPASGRNTRPEHELVARVGGWHRQRNHENETRLIEAGQTVSGQRATTAGPANRWNLDLDYGLPLGEKNKFEAGYQGRLETAEENSRAWEYLPAQDSWQYQDRFSRDAGANHCIHALYTTYSGEWQALGYKGGLRGERAERTITAGDDTFAIPVRWDLFPTAHLSWQLPANVQLMASYARRIGRTRHFFLDPFEVWQDAYTVVRGNPELLPEYIDSWELGTLVPFGASRLSAELFHRVTGNKVERIISLYPDTTGVMLHTFENVGSDRSLGLELMLDLTPVKWYTLTLGGDLYDYRVEGELEGRDFSYSSFNCSGRLGNEFRFPTNTRVQLNARYRSPSVTAQGSREGSLMTDLGIRQQFLNRQLSVTFQVRDLFGTGRHEFESGGDGYDFYSRSISTRQAPVLMLNLSWNFNNFRPDRRQRDDDLDLGPSDGDM